MSDEFREYIENNFVEVCSTKNFLIKLKKEIFNENPDVKIKCNKFLYDQITSYGKISELNTDSWLESTGVSIELYDNLEEFNFYNYSEKQFNISEVNSLENNFTLVVYLYTHKIPTDKSIISKGNIWNLKFGSSNDLYLEVPNTSKGYGWIDGVYFDPYLSLPTCVVIKYSKNEGSIYVNNVKKTDVFFLIENETRNTAKPIDLLIDNDPLIIGNKDFQGRIKLLIFNRIFEDSEIKKLCSLVIENEYAENLIFEL
jgi:hypothetical protein